MSIYATWLGIEDVRQEAEMLAEYGIKFGVMDEAGEVEDLDTLEEEMLDAPIIYEGSHVLPSDSDRRGGSVDIAAIPDHISRDDRPDAPEGALKDWLRLSVDSEDSLEQYEGKTYQEGGRAVVVLTRKQVERMRDTLTKWLDRSAE